jgi:hypothetical protein
MPRDTCLYGSVRKFTPHLKISHTIPEIDARAMIANGDVNAIKLIILTKFANNAILAIEQRGGQPWKIELLQ